MGKTVPAAFGLLQETFLLLFVPSGTSVDTISIPKMTSALGLQPSDLGLRTSDFCEPIGGRSLKAKV